MQLSVGSWFLMAVGWIAYCLHKGAALCKVATLLAPWQMASIAQGPFPESMCAAVACHWRRRWVLGGAALATL